MNESQKFGWRGFGFGVLVAAVVGAGIWIIFGRGGGRGQGGYVPIVSVDVPAKADTAPSWTGNIYFTYNGPKGDCDHVAVGYIETAVKPLPINGVAWLDSAATKCMPQGAQGVKIVLARTGNQIAPPGSAYEGKIFETYTLQPPASTTGKTTYCIVVTVTECASGMSYTNYSDVFSR